MSYLLKLCVAAFVTTVAIGGAFWMYEWSEWEPRFDRHCSVVYPLLSPLLDCKREPDETDKARAIRSEVVGIIEHAKALGNVERTSFFYRDLNSRRSIGVDATENYAPASLFKLPLAMLFFMLSESDNKVLEKKVTVTAADIELDERMIFRSTSRLEPGEYSVRELIESMLKHSLNSPVRPLFVLGNPFFDTILTDIGIYIPGQDESEATLNISPYTYSNLFRILYNGSYLTFEDSNMILEMLSHSEFQRGIARVPQGVLVAHKFGEKTNLNNQGEVVSRILSHCGIVYKPHEPYIICIMTEGKNFDEQLDVIEEIANRIYDKQ